MKIPIVPLFLPLLANAYTWKFTSEPHQCQDLSIAVEGSGQPPYSLLIIPSGPSPLPNKVEVRQVQNIPFSGDSSTLSFKLDYPANSSFVAVVSDSSGFGSGGTSVPVTVLQSSDSSCYDASQQVQIPFFFYFNPTGGLRQCGSTRIWWAPSTVNGTTKFYGAIPGGNSFAIPQGTLSSANEVANNETGIGFPWIVDITGGTNVILIGSDDRGIGSGGSAAYTIAPTPDDSCLDSTSPSSTPGSPAGGSYPTGTGSTSRSDSGGIHSNTGAIVGGVVGSAVLLLAVALVAFLFLRRRLYSAISKERPINVLQDDEDSDSFHHDLPHSYMPEPFLFPSPTSRGTFKTDTTQESLLSLSMIDAGRPLSLSIIDAGRPLPLSMIDAGYPLSLSVIDAGHLQTPVTATTTSTPKSAVPPQLRPINIIQHDDAGPSEDPASRVEPRTIELPPAYSNIRQKPRSPLATSTTPHTVRHDS